MAYLIALAKFGGIHNYFGKVGGIDIILAKIGGIGDCFSKGWWQWQLFIQRLVALGIGDFSKGWWQWCLFKKRLWN